MKTSELPSDPKGKWFRENPEALKFAETWIEMSADGATDFTLTRFVNEVLRARYKFPWRDIQSTGRWLRKVFGDAYDRAMASRTTRY